MIIPTSHKAASSGDDVLEGASVEGNSRTGLLNIVILLEDQLRPCAVCYRRRVDPIVQKVIWIK